MVESPNDADPDDPGSPMEPDSKGRRLVIPAATEDARFIATLGPAERAEFLSHHYKLQQVEELTTRETQAFQGCAWRGGLYCAGFTLAAGSSHLVGRSRLLWGAPDWVHGIVGLLGVIGALLCLGFLFPAIFGFFRWIFAMRDRRRLGRVVVMPAAALRHGPVTGEGQDQNDGAST